MFVNRIINTTNALLNGRNGISPKINKFLTEHGDNYITQLIIARVPLSNGLVKTVNLLSPNFKNKNDTVLYYLFLIIRTNKNSYVLEKNSGIEISNYKPQKNEELMHVNIPSGLTFNIILNRTRELMGNNFTSYSARDNNCSDFVISLLKSNRLATSANIEFVDQTNDHLFTDNFRKISNTVTGITNKIDIIKSGGNI